jgi:hypothetical protein
VNYIYETTYKSLIIVTIIIIGLVFFNYDSLLFTEANDWFFSMYVAEAVINSSTNIYMIDQLNTPNSLFFYTYLYLRDVLFFIDPYTLMKFILFCLFVAFNILVYKLSEIKQSYVLLYPLSMSYILVGGMVNYYFGVVLVLLFVYLVEKKEKLSLLGFTLIIFLTYHAHFMALFALMIFILHKFGLKTALSYSFLPFLLLISYKVNNYDFHRVGGDYGMLNHILSIRRVLLPAIVDTYYVDRIWQYFFSSIVNLTYLLASLFFFYKLIKEKMYTQDARLLLIMLILFYFLVPASLPGSGLNIHERLIIPFLIFLLYEVNINSQSIKILFALIALFVSINLLYSQHISIPDKYRVHSEYTCNSLNGESSHNLKNPLTNRSPIGRSVFFSEKIVDKENVDDIIIPDLTVLFTASISKYKYNNPYINNGGC